MASFYISDIFGTLAAPFAESVKITTNKQFEYTPELVPNGECNADFPKEDNTIKSVPKGYIEHSNRLKATVFAERLGVSMANGVDRLIFKNHEFSPFFDRDYLFNKGYFGSVEEYKNLVDCASTQNLFTFPKIKTKEIYKGTRVLVILDMNTEQAKQLVGRVIDVCKNTDNNTYYKIEYQYDTKQANKEEDAQTRFSSIWKTLKKGVSVSVEVLNTLAGMKEQAEIEPLYSDFEDSIKNRAKNAAADENGIEPPMKPHKIKYRGLPENLIHTKIAVPPSEYKVYDKWIHENFVYKERVYTTSKHFMRMNDEVNIPFRNPALFPVFHMIKYAYGKMFNFGRIHLIWHMVNALINSMKPYKHSLREIAELVPMDEMLMQNLKKANNPVVEKEVEILSNTEVERQDNADITNEGTTRTSSGGRTAKTHGNTHNKSQKKQKGGLNVSGTTKGDIGVIIDKIGKYMYCKNLRLIHSHEQGVVGKQVESIKSAFGKKPEGPNPYAKFTIPETHVMYYVEQEQRRFLGLGIMYFSDTENRDHNNRIFMEPYPFVNYLDIGVDGIYDNATPEEQYNLNNTIDSFLQNQYPEKSTYELVQILADFVWPERKHSVDAATKGGDLGIRKGLSAAATAVSKTVTKVDHAVKKGTNTAIQSVGELATKNNMVLNALFDYSFKRMVYYRLVDMHRSVFMIDGKFTKSGPKTREQSQQVSENIVEMCNFYYKLKFAFIRGGHFPCSSALNIISGLTSNPVAEFIKDLLPPVLAPFIQVNTPQCYCACIIGAKALFSMYPYPSTYMKIYTQRMLGLRVANNPAEIGDNLADVLLKSNKEKVMQFVKQRNYKGCSTLEEVPNTRAFYIVDLTQEKLALSDKYVDVEEYKKQFKRDRDNEADLTKYPTGTMSNHPYFIVTEEYLESDAISGGPSQTTSILPTPSPVSDFIDASKEYIIAYNKDNQKYKLLEIDSTGDITSPRDIVFKYENTVVTHEDVRKFMKYYLYLEGIQKFDDIFTGFEIYESTGKTKLFDIKNEYPTEMRYKLTPNNKTPVDFHDLQKNIIAMSELQKRLGTPDKIKQFTEKYNSNIPKYQITLFGNNFTILKDTTSQKYPTNNYINALAFYRQPTSVLPTPSPVSDLIDASKEYRIWPDDNNPRKYMLFEMGPRNFRSNPIDIVFQYKNTDVTHEDVHKFMKDYEKFVLNKHIHDILTGFEIYESTRKTKLFDINNEKPPMRYEKKIQNNTPVDFHDLQPNFIAMSELQKQLETPDKIKRFTEEYHKNNNANSDDKIYTQTFDSEFTIVKDTTSQKYPTNNYIKALAYYKNNKNT